MTAKIARNSHTPRMQTEHDRKAQALARTVAMLQVKLLLGAARDLALSPLTLAAALIDFAFLKEREPRHLRTVLRWGERVDEWIDIWSGARAEGEPPRENVDVLLARIEEAVRDPQTGARRARVLKRWAERQAVRARRRALDEIQTRMPSLSDPTAAPKRRE